MARLEISPRAVLDLEEIVDYIARDKPRAAIALVEKLKAKCETLAAFPLLDEVRDDLAPAVRALSAGNYVIYCRPIADGIRVERVLHGARDPDAFLR